MRPIPHISTCKLESKLLKTDGDRWTIFRMGPVHAQDNNPWVSGIESERAARYRDLLCAWTGIGCHRSHKNKRRGLWHIQQEIRGGGVPVHPTKTPGGLQVESQVLLIQYLYGHHKHKSYIGIHQFPPSRCKLFNYYRLSSDNVHSVFTVIQYLWLTNYGDQQEYSIRSLPVSGGSRIQKFKSTRCSIIIMLSPRKSDNYEYAM